MGYWAFKLNVFVPLCQPVGYSVSQADSQTDRQKGQSDGQSDSQLDDQSKGPCIISFSQKGSISLFYVKQNLQYYSVFGILWIPHVWQNSGRKPSFVSQTAVFFDLGYL